MANPVEFYRRMSLYERAKLTGTLGMVFNFANAAFKTAVGLFTFVAALCVSGLYSFFTGLAKRVYFRGMRKSGINERKESRYYFAMGIILTASSAFYIVYMLRYAFGGTEKTVGPAAFAFVAGVAVADFALAVIGLVRARRERDLLSEGLKLVNLSTSFAAIATAVTAVSALAGLKGETYAMFNGAFGAAMGVAEAAIGIYMCLKGALYYLRLRGKKRVTIIESPKT